jgi:hypothetical protein
MIEVLATRPRECVAVAVCDHTVGVWLGAESEAGLNRLIASVCVRRADRSSVQILWVD